jgi:hypothetical protein
MILRIDLLLSYYTVIYRSIITVKAPQCFGPSPKDHAMRFFWIGRRRRRKRGREGGR